MILRIDNIVEGQRKILRLSGGIDAEQLRHLKAEIEVAGRNVAMDLEDVNLVDQDAVTFLATCEANGVELRRCSRYLRNWITKEKTKQDNP